MEDQLPSIPETEIFADKPPDDFPFKENPDTILNSDTVEQKVNLFKDTFEIEDQHHGEDTSKVEHVEVDFSRSFPVELSLEIHNHLERALKEIIHIPSSRKKEREGVLEAEKQIRYKIIEQAQFKERFKKEIPIVKPKRVIVRRKKVITPARRLPKYIPKVDGGMWKVWGYPEFIELSTSSSEEVVEIPEGVELDQDGYPLLDPDRFDFTTLSPKWVRVLGKVALYLLQSVSGFFMVKYSVKLWRSYTKEAQQIKSNKPPNISETSEDTDSD